MHKNIWLVCVAVCLSLTACQRPAEENKAKFPRKANIEKYLQKAKDASRMAEERKNPLPVADLIDSSVLTNTAQKIESGFLKQLLEKNKSVLEKRLLETYGQKTSEQVAAMMRQHTLQAQQAAQAASSAGQLDKEINRILDAQKTQMQAFLDAQKAITRLTPDQQLLEHAKIKLTQRTEAFLANMALYHGEESAKQSAPVLEKAVQDYIYAMASAADPKALQEKIDEISAQAEEQIIQLNTQYSDPLGVSEEDKITSLRADMITRHQTLESFVEPLYGKEAVLQMRKAFNEVLESTGQTLRENKRLSQKKQQLQELNGYYRQAMLNLQQKWNAELGLSATADTAPSASK